MRHWQINIAYGASTGLRHDAEILENLILRSFPGILVRKYDGAYGKTRNSYQLLKQLFSTYLLHKHQVTLHLEELYTEISSFSDANVLFPNQEWLRSKTQKNINENIHLSCKSHYALSQLLKKWPQAQYNGFTSIDMKNDFAKKDYRRFIHVAGKSEQKGTIPLLKCWQSHPEWPTLTVVSRLKEHAEYQANNIKLIQRFLPHDELKVLLNTCAIHLCPSEAEGFGHSINEAMSTAAVLAVTDAAPMNEFGNTPFRFRVTSKSSRYMSSLNYCDEDSIEKTVEEILRTSQEELANLGESNRLAYEKNHSLFSSQLTKLLSLLMIEHTLSKA